MSLLIDDTFDDDGGEETSFSESSQRRERHVDVECDNSTNSSIAELSGVPRNKVIECEESVHTSIMQKMCNKDRDREVVR